MTTTSMAIWGAWILLLVIRIFNMILPQLQQLQPLLSKVLRLLLVRLLAPHLAIDLLRPLSIRLQDLNQKWESPKSPKMFRKFFLADSFIMSVLRGWRLLKVASLTPEGTRDIVSTTHKISKISTPSAKPCLPFGMNSCLVTVIHHMLDRLGAGHNSNAHAGNDGSGSEWQLVNA